MIATKRILVGQIEKVFGLILTAGHVIYNFRTSRLYEERTLCFLENGEVEEAHLIKHFIEEYPYELKSTITDAFYCLPGDCGIMLIQVNGEIDYYELSRHIEVNSDCIISGYPVRPNEINCCLPQLKGLSRREIELKACRIFCNFDRKVYSEGEIKSENNGIIELACSTANGMSGSPIISQGCVVGIYVGGPPVPGQREVMKILQNLNKNESISDAIRDLEILRNYDRFFTVGLFSRILDSQDISTIKLIIKAQSEVKLSEEEERNFAMIQSPEKTLVNLVHEFSSGLCNLIYKAVSFFKHKGMFQANIGISTNHMALTQDVPEIQRRFSLINSCDTIEDLLNQLKA